jgi:hypothetical protein
VQDYRALNKITVKDAYPLPLIAEAIDKIHGSYVLSKIDLRRGFNNLRIDPADEHKTAFISQRGTFQFRVTPLGTQGSPGAFQRFVDHLFNHNKDAPFVVAYVDDLLVFSKNLEEHEEHLKQMFDILKANHLHCAIEKVALVQEKVEYLGHIVSGGEVYPDPKHTEAIRKRTRPENKHELLSFLSACSWLRKFIRNFSKIAAPLYDLMGGGPPSERTKRGLAKAQLNWTDRHEVSFKTLIDAICAATRVAIPDPNGEFTVVLTDASDFAIGAALFQGGKPVAFGSQRLNPTQMKWPVRDKEMFAIRWACREWSHYLHKPFIVKTDHKSLSGFHDTPLHDSKLSDRTFWRWVEELQHYPMRIEYTKGVYHSLPDWVSRPTPRDGTSHPPDPETVHVNTAQLSASRPKQRTRHAVEQY